MVLAALNVYQMRHVCISYIGFYIYDIWWYCYYTQYECIYRICQYLLHLLDHLNGHPLLILIVVCFVFLLSIKYKYSLLIIIIRMIYSVYIYIINNGKQRNMKLVFIVLLNNEGSISFMQHRHYL